MDKGTVFEVGLLWALKTAADPHAREEYRVGHNEFAYSTLPAVEILDPLPPAYESYRSVLADYMQAHPGCKSWSPGFPAPPALVENAA